MPEFAFIFRPTRALHPEELAPRNDAAREWALLRRREGILYGASPLEPAGVTVTRDGVSAAPREPTVASVLVIAAQDLDAAVRLAKTHPGLAFGTEIEVRVVKPTVPPAP